MALHARDKVLAEMLDDVYASSDLSIQLPKYKFPESEHAPRHAYSLVHDELMLDGNARQNLATFCQTWAEPEVHRLMDECVDKNMIDKDEYPQTAELDHRLQRSGDAGRHGDEMALESKDEGCWQADRPAEPDHRAGADLLAQVHPLLGRGAPGDPDGPWPIADDAGRSAKAV